MSEENNKDLIEALKEHTRALDEYVAQKNNPYLEKPVVIDYTGLLQSIDSRLDKIEKNMPNKPVGKY